MRILAAAALLLAAAASAAAPLPEGEAVLRFKDGRLLPGRVVEVDEEGVRHESERGTMFWSWDLLTPFGQYEARVAALEASRRDGDGEARLALGRWALAHGLPMEARREILRARGLGAGQAHALDALLEECDRVQAEEAFAAADREAEAGDFAGALEVLRSFLVQAPASEWTEKARDRAADLVRRREAAEARRRLEEERRRKAEAEERRLGTLRRYLGDADGARTEGGRFVLVGLREESGGSFTQFRDALARAEKAFLEARRDYERARRLAGPERPDLAREALSGRRAVEGRLLDVFVRLARKLVAFKNWKEAQEALDKALRLDPVHPEALDLQEKVKENWIRKKASGLTNASGRSSDGSGR